MLRLMVFLVMFATAPPALAEEARLDELFAALKTADESSWEAIEDRIWAEWSESGSAAMNLLLERGRSAMAADAPQAAVEHLTALVENAPDFAEGWNARATAYFQLGLYGPALADIARALALEPRHFGALSGLAVILEETGALERAARVYGAALAIHPRRPDLREALDRLEAELRGKSI